MGYLCVVHWDSEEALLLQKLDPLLWFLVELFCASDEKLEEKYYMLEAVLPLNQTRAS